MVNYLSTTQRNQPRSNSPTDPYSDWVYAQRPKMNTGFVAFDIDGIFWNYEKRTFCFIEVKTNNATLSYCQSIVLPLLQKIQLSGATSEGFTFKGFWVLTFERTCFHDGTATMQRVGESKVHHVTSEIMRDWIIRNY